MEKLRIHLPHCWRWRPAQWALGGVVSLVTLWLVVLAMWLVMEMLCMEIIMSSVVVVYVVQLKMWFLMSMVIWMMGRFGGMRNSFCRMWRMRVVWVEWLQFGMKWDEGGMENVWRWRVSWSMSRARERKGCVAKAVS